MATAGVTLVVAMHWHKVILGEGCLLFVHNLFEFEWKVCFTIIASRGGDAPDFSLCTAFTFCATVLLLGSCKTHQNAIRELDCTMQYYNAIECQKMQYYAITKQKNAR